LAKPADGQAVQNAAPEPVADAVLGQSVLAGMVGDGTLDNGHARLAHEHRHEPVHAVERGNVRNAGAAKALGAAAGITDAVMQNGLAHAIGNAA